MNDWANFFDKNGTWRIAGPDRSEPSTIKAGDESDEVRAHNETYTAGYTDGWNTRKATTDLQPVRSKCAWCGLILLADAKGHVGQCERGPYKVALARLRDYEAILVGEEREQPGETLLMVLNRLTYQADRWRESCAVKKSKRAIKRATP